MDRKVVFSGDPDQYGYGLVERAISNRSSCNSCQMPIAMGEARVGKKAQSRFHDGFEITWTHVRCSLKPMMKKLTQLKGWQVMSYDEQFAIRKHTGELLAPAVEAQLKADTDRLRELADLVVANFKRPQMLEMLHANKIDTDAMAKRPLTMSVRIADGLLYGAPMNCPECGADKLSVFPSGVRCRGAMPGGFTKCVYQCWPEDVKRYEWSTGGMEVGGKAHNKWLAGYLESNPIGYAGAGATSAAAAAAAAPASSQLVDSSDDDESEAEDAATDLNPSGMKIAELRAALKERGLDVKGLKAALVQRLEDALAGAAPMDLDDAAEEEEEEDVDYAKMRVPALREALTAKGLPSTGRKADLVARLQAASASSSSSAASAKKKPAAARGTKRKASASSSSAAASAGNAAKRARIVLERKPSSTAASLEAAKTTDGRRKERDAVKSVRLPPRPGSAILQLDEKVSHASGQMVVDPKDGVTVYNAPLTQVNLESGHNKLYKIQLYKVGATYYLYRRWGRVGATDDSYKKGGGGYYGSKDTKTETFSSLAKAVKGFKELFHKFTNFDWDRRDEFETQPGKYTFVELDTGNDDTPKGKKKGSKSSSSAAAAAGPSDASQLDPRVRSLVDLIFDQEAMLTAVKRTGFNVDKMPLGKIQKSTILRGYSILKELDQHLTDAARERAAGTGDERILAAKLLDRSTAFYSVIPSSNPEKIDTVEKMKQKIVMLDTLMDVSDANDAMDAQDDSSSANQSDKNYASLATQIRALDHDSDAWTMIQKYVSNHHDKKEWGWGLEIEDVYEIARDGEDGVYKPHADDHNRQLLWHGSRLTNFIGLLSQGMRIAPPEAPVSGYLFGKGAYMANMVSKSSNYCRTSSDAPTGLMLLAEVALGDMYELSAPQYMEQAPPGKKSTKCNGVKFPDPKEDVTLADGTTVPLGKPATRAGRMGYDEFIVYDTSQIKFRYLVRMNFSHTKSSWWS